MTMAEALRQADETLEKLIASGDPVIMEAARGPDGKIDQEKLASAAMRARWRLAEKIMAESGGQGGSVGKPED